MPSDLGSASDEILNPATESESRDSAGASPLSGRAIRREPRSQVDVLRGRVYGFEGLADYRLSDRLVIRSADIGSYLLIKLICSTLRWEVRGYEHFDSIAMDGRRAIFTFWHSCIFAATWFWRNRGIVVMSSTSRDAEFTARFIKRFGYGTARGSATRGSGRALAEMADCLKSGMEVAFTIDGPRGPAYVAKPGAVTLARHTGQAILPFHIATRHCVELPSWDRLKIPLPFTRALTLIGEPIYLARDASSDQVALAQTALQSTLDKLRSEGDAWRDSKKNVQMR